MASEHRSIWIPADATERYRPLAGDVTADVVVVGAGITGLTCAWLLQRDGRDVVVLDSHRVGTGTTGHTTGKVTSQHGLAYQRLVNEHGEDVARLYGEANQHAVDTVARIAGEVRVDPDAISTVPTYVHTCDAGFVPRLEQEASVARRLGLPASLADGREVGLDGVLAAVRFDGQRLLDAYRYVAAIASALEDGGARIHEHSGVLTEDEDDTGVTVRTADGSVRAQHSVIATLLPITNAGLFFARTRASRAYGLAARLAGQRDVPVTITAEEPTRSTRPWRADDGAPGVIVVGEQHETGTRSSTRPHYAALEAWARTSFDVTSVEATWSAQDYRTVDQRPYVGRAPTRRRTWVATGYRKWGLTNGTAAAEVLAALIAGRGHPWARLYDSSRVGGARALGRAAMDNSKVGAHFVGDRIGRLRAGRVDELRPGEGGIVRQDGQTVGAYRAPDGGLHGVELTCTHLGCSLSWNDAETTWDCPCHGSRFGHDGTVLQGPATRGLAQVDLEATPPS